MTGIIHRLLDQPHVRQLLPLVQHGQFTLLQSAEAKYTFPALQVVVIDPKSPGLLSRVRAFKLVKPASESSGMRPLSPFVCKSNV
mmetsp:Transcript_10185/g.18201  ORF Transcript_10185/g.18201 Transcript_10185/m.18201 type:complete len:85 (+) Transcript_10185:629-883(+)